MSYLGFEPMRLEKFGGLNSLIDATNLPIYASPDCSDVEFLPGLVRTRPGLPSLFTALGGNPTVNYLKSYITPAALLRALALDSNGIFYNENPQGTLVNLATIEQPGAYGNSVSLFGKEYLAITDGKFGSAIPRQFNDINFDRVSQCSPGAAPMAVEENNSAATLASPNGLIQFPNNTISAVGVPGLSQSGYLVTVTVTAALPTQLQVGDSIQIAGAGVASYNGTWIVTAILSTTSFQFLNTVSGLANSGGGSVAYQLVTVVSTGAPTNLNAIIFAGQLVTISGATVAAYNSAAGIPWAFRAFTGINSGVIVISTFGNAVSGTATITTAGSIVAGVHRVSVMFVTRTGYITAPAPFSSFTATGGKRVILSSIPVGPPSVIQRIVCFTAAGGQNFFYQTSGTGGTTTLFSGNFILADNVTETAIFDFSDTTLLQGINVDALFNLLELGECAGVMQYSSRLFWWGERNKIQNVVNFSFDGGFANRFQVTAYPFGWLRDPNVGLGGGSAVTIPVQVVWGDAYEIGGDGVTAIRGRITQSVWQDSLGNPILQPNTAYSVRARISRYPVNPLTAGTVHIHAFSASGGINTAGIQVGFGAITTSFVEYVAAFLPVTAVIPSDLVIRVYVDGTPNNGGTFIIDCIEIFPTNQPNNVTVVRASKVEDPESYDGVTGFLQIGENNGQAVRTGFVIRNNLYFVKERSLYVTQDDGQNEPNQWTVQEISQKVGTLSVRGVGLGDEWAIIAGVDGVYYFDGNEPQKISQEIQPTWDSINWSLGHLIDVKVDTKRKRVYIAVPLGASATANNRVLTLDYVDGFGDPNPTNTMNIAGVGRKWSPWAVACNSMNFILRSDGTQQLWFGNGTGLRAATGKIYQLDATGTIFDDDGIAINSYWQSGYFQTEGRMTFGPLVANVIGVGACNLILRKGDQGWVTNLRSWTLSTLGFRNMERMLNIETERLAVRFGTNAIGSHFSLQGLALYAKEATWAVLRGQNA